MSMSSVGSCKLNKKYTSAIKSKRFVIEQNRYENYLQDTTVEYLGGPTLCSTGMTCCGLDELDFTRCQDHWDRYKNNKKVFLEWISCYIHWSVGQSDKRILIVGIPTKVSTHSQYDIAFYRLLAYTLKSIGFKQVGSPYKNENSSNTIVALVGQLP